MPMSLVERALDHLPHVGLVNAYGLTETSSTIAVLGPEDHREAAASDEPGVRARLGSVGRPLPNLEVEIRDPLGVPVPAGTHGEIWVRGDQVSGEYLGKGASLSPEGWLATNDGGWLDAEGFLFVEGRLDDVIVRGGENLSPGEIEDVLLMHAAVADCAVIGIPDEEWGEAVAAVIVLHEGEAGRPRGPAGLGGRAPPLDPGPPAHRVPLRTALQRDRQAPAPGPQGRDDPGVRRVLTPPGARQTGPRRTPRRPDPSAMPWRHRSPVHRAPAAPCGAVRPAG